ncbi:YjbF family lipoprotein [Pseudidiomarina taiwanensis]|uniref:YjbF family lipoprotein n=1 Tax=Pseudidiomarina taiwanensis TaxID=337250 RepID=A0A432ZKF1_9GAMM|nr:YjbF family lipoprotein [Pseudidiomarina taiwanensis]RUO78419.1 hypothetical protein CWI83_05170 [Pseudidiomarina taiwanensis]
MIARLYKIAILVLLVNVLAGCSQRVNAIAEMGRAFFTEPEPILLSLDEIRALDYAALYVQLDNSPRILAVLNQASENQLTWRIGSRDFLYSQNGRIVGTESLTDFPQQTSARGQDPLSCFRKYLQPNSAIICPDQWRRKVTLQQADGSNAVLQRVWIKSTIMRTEKVESITLLSGITVPAFRIIETGEWNVDSTTKKPILFENIFWQHATNGRIVKTQQFISPAHGYLLTEEVVPFIGDFSVESDES